MTRPVRISNLGVSQYCRGSNHIRSASSMRSKRSTIYHKFLETGVLDEVEMLTLSPSDRDEIRQWSPPQDVVFGGREYSMSDAVREALCGLDEYLNYVPVERNPDSGPGELPYLYPESTIAVGACDLYLPSVKVDGKYYTVVIDGKSSIHAVSDGTDSLQLHGYGWSLAKKHETHGYIAGIWDLSDSRYYWGSPVLFRTIESIAIGERILVACDSERPNELVTGPHCAGCWKRFACPAHIVDVPEGRLKGPLGPNPSAKDIADGLVLAKSLRDTSDKLYDNAKAWVAQHGEVSNESGTHTYGLKSHRGRRSLNKKAVMAALGVSSLDAFMSEGAPYTRKQWRKKND